jgi:CHAT domain-containing protein
VSTNIADKLMGAQSVESFLTEQGGRVDWQMMAALKTGVDRLADSDPETAENLVTRITQLGEMSDDAASKAFAEASRARLLYNRGLHAEADSIYERAAATLRDEKLPAEAAYIQMQRLHGLVLMGRYSEALRLANSVRRVFQKGEKTRLAQLENNIGNIYYRLDDYKKALQHYDRAHEMLSATGDQAMLAFVDFSRSNIFTELDRPAEALKLIESAAQAWESEGRALLACQARFHIAYIEFLRGNYNTALASYYRTRDRLIELGATQLVAFCNLDIADVLLALNAFDDAIESASQARSSFSDLGMEYDAAKAALTGAIASIDLRQFDQAQTSLTETREIYARSGNTIFTAMVDSYLADLHLRQGDAAEASRTADQALKIFARQKLSTRASYLRLIIARSAYKTGDLNKAARISRLALKKSEGLFAPGIEYQCHHLIGKIEKDRGRSNKALERFRSAVAIVEQMRGGIAADEFKATFLRDKIEVYEDAINACLDEGSQDRVEEAFRLVESSKSRALADLLARYLRSSAEVPAPGRGQNIQEDVRTQLLKLIEDLNWYSSRAGLEDDKGKQRRAGMAERYRREVRRCERQIAQLFRRLESEDSSLAEIHRFPAITSSDLQAALEKDETAIEFFITGDQISAFVASRNRVRLVRSIASRREIEQMILSLRFQIEKFNFGSDYVEAFLGQLKRAIDDYLSRLYKEIFAPLEPFIDSDQLIVIPHGALHYIPFHALRDSSDYLVDRFEISYAPSASVLRMCRADRKPVRAQNGHQKLVALGVVHPDTPSIEDEIVALNSIFPDAVTLVGNKATRENLFKAAPEADYLHLASHGYFRRDNPMFSFLKLADSSLNFYSLLDLKLNAKMVTLSACHTGVNMVFPGDELHGLMRGFLYAGAPSLIASLWAVSDSSTAELMREMYRLIQSGETKRKALRSAQIRVKDAYGHPYYWAPFMLMGNPV